MKRDKKAVAIKYNSGEKAPKLIAKGKRKLAEKIVEIAREKALVVVTEKGAHELGKTVAAAYTMEKKLKEQG